jgi:chromosomal replication initiator protein
VKRRKPKGPSVFSRAQLERIVNFVVMGSGADVEDLLGPCRKRRLVECRQLGMWLAHQDTDASYPQIAHAFGGRHHSTAIHAVKTIDKKIAEDARWNQLAIGALARLRGSQAEAA